MIFLAVLLVLICYKSSRAALRTHKDKESVVKAVKRNDSAYLNPAEHFAPVNQEGKPLLP